MKKHLLIIGSGFVLGILFYFYFKTQTSINAIKHSLEILLSGCFGVLISYVCHTISKKLDMHISWEHALANRFLTGIILNFIAAYTMIVALVYFYTSILQLSSFEYNRNALITLGVLLFIVMLLYNIIYFMLYSYHNYAQGQIDKITYKRKQIDLQLKALKSQLNAHFLFNNLNTISSLAHKSPDLCEDYIRGLANIYEYSLNSYHSSLVTLEEEVNVVTSYLELLKTRFGNALLFKLNIPKELLQRKLPPLTLQMLVENAVKHNQMDANHVLQLTINGNKNHVEVTNNITKAVKNITSFNIGLKTIEARYKLLNDLTIDIIKDSGFTVKVPVI